MTTLIHDIDVLDVRGDPGSSDVSAVAFDSRRVTPGSLFCCVPGEHTDGHRHAGHAVAAGATSLLCERFLDLDVTQVRVAPGGVRPAMASVAAALAGHPSRAMTMVGVTGTNGKTTVTHLVRSILNHAGTPTGVIGTLDGARTTPESPVLQAHLADLRADGIRAVAMEVSSHGLEQHRVDGIVFDVAAFTNLSRDHLDHHGTMEAYFEAKAHLFDPDRAKVAVINVDDRWGGRLADQVAGHRVVRVNRSDVDDIVTSVGSLSFRWRGRRFTVPLSGLFNVDNALLAATVADALGVDEDQIAAGLAGVEPVPGRMEVVEPGPPFVVVVDYAHTPAGLDAALSAARGLTGSHGPGPGRAGSHRVICLFGCGGDRDPGKRPAMGAVAARLSDVTVLTSDNPRSEDPMAIIDQVRSGMVDGPAPAVEPDRGRAIRLAVGLAEPGDVVVIAGKGHETTQVLSGRTVPFDDRAEARAAVAARRRHAGAPAVGEPAAGEAGR
jgi:UDP-N-acetylmuramoyl-L-alanyl-D-glutamate--2,6-diaminopimelate ligase